MSQRLTYLLILTFLVSCSELHSQTAVKFEPPAGTMVEKSVQVTMRDGARLNTLVMLPKISAEQKVPSILIRTPYKTEIRGARPLHYTLLEQGYAVLMQHERGRYFSEGDFEMLGGALNDGWDTMDWIANQSWSNGKVGTYGCSSSGENQLKLAAAAHPAHKAMVAGSVGVGVAEAGPFREQGNFWRGGVWQQGWMNYFYTSMFQHWPQLPKQLSNEQRQRTINFLDLNNTGWRVPDSRFNETRMHLPMIEIMDILQAPKNQVQDYLTVGPVHDSWSKQRVSQGEMIAVPGMWFESVYDISMRSSLAFFEWNRQANATEGRKNQVMRLTQGGHCSFGRSNVESKNAKIGDLELGDMRYDYIAQTLNWYDRWLRDKPQTEQALPAYQAFVGYGQWLNADALPMAGNTTWYLDQNALLDKKKPEAVTSYTYQYNPLDPVPSVGGEIYGEGDDHEDGSFDQRVVQKREDVLVFTSAPLTSDTTLFGMAEIGLAVASNQPDTDFTVKINDVYPDGRSFNIGNTIQRMRYRNGLEQAEFMQKEQVYDINLPPIMLSRLIKKGHRIQVEVSSSNFPAYARNLNTSANPYTSVATAIATNSIFVGGEHRSFIKLPVQTGQ